jgi:hypothetical protein
MKTFNEFRKNELQEGVFSVKLDKPYKRGDEKMYMNIIKKHGGKNLKFSPPKGRDLELDIYFDGGDIKKIKSNLPNKGKGSEWISESIKLQEKLGFNGSYQRKSKYDGKEFDRIKEVKQLYKIEKLLMQADKLHSDLQYPNTVDAVSKIWDNINKAYIGIQTYVDHIKKGDYDGKIDMDS